MSNGDLEDYYVSIYLHRFINNYWRKSQQESGQRYMIDHTNHVINKYRLQRLSGMTCIKNIEITHAG